MTVRRSPRGLDLTDVDDNFRDRFWGKVQVRSSDECWEWTAYRKPGGYGQFTVRKGVFFNAPIVAAALSLGPVPPGYYVCHHCDNPPCVNPAHLFIGTPTDNAVDMVAKGRAPRSRGVARFNAVLDDDAVRDIRASYGAVPTKALAQRYGVSTTAIRAVASGMRWRHVA